MRQTKIKSKLFAKLLKDFKRNFPRQKLPDNGHVENRYQASGDDTHISHELKNALLDNSPDYQKFKKNNPKLYENSARPNRGFLTFQEQFLGPAGRKPPTSIFGGGRGLNNF